MDLGVAGSSPVGRPIFAVYFVYILWCRETGNTHVGQTDNLVRRFRAHTDGSTRTTRDRLRAPVVIYWESQPTRSSAVRREKYFKQGAGHRRKLQLVAEATAWFGRIG